jgi:hypothetical protein
MYTIQDLKKKCSLLGLGFISFPNGGVLPAAPYIPHTFWKACADSLTFKVFGNFQKTKTKKTKKQT